MSEKCEKFYREAIKLEEELGSEKEDNSRKHAMCSKLEQLVTQLNSIHAALIQTVKANFATGCSTTLSEHAKNHHGMLRQYQQTAESGNQTLLVSSTSAVDKDPKETVIDTGMGKIEIAVENIEVSSRQSATHGSRKGSSIGNSRSSRRRQFDEMRLENLRANKKTEPPTNARAAVGFRAGT